MSVLTKHKILKLFIFLCLFSCSGFAFNIDESNPIVKLGPDEVQFGVSVAHHSDLNGKKYILVGAPNTNVTTESGRVVVNAGAVYKCPLSRNVSDCTELSLRNRDESLVTSRLGASIKSQSSGKKGFVAVCANHWNWVRTMIKTNESRKYNKEYIETKQYVSGRCFVLDNNLEPFLQLNGTSFKTEKNSMVHDRVMCELGTSVDFGADNLLMIGAPGCYEARGSALLLSIGENKKIEKSLQYDRYYSKKIKSHELDAYNGYSVSASKEQTNLTVSGAPRMKNNKGCVYVMFRRKSRKSTHVFEEEFCGNQTGSSYGAAVLITDLNRDGLEDLIVGAPRYTDVSRKVSGLVHIYLRADKNFFLKFDEPIEIRGPYETNSEFGATITEIGDVNYDGFTDIAIGAPNSDGGSGAVYIYNGRNTDDLKTMQYSQKIQGKKIQHNLQPPKMLRSFGYSMDSDVNEFDLESSFVVGSESGVVFAFKARPVVSVDVTTSTSVSLLNTNPDSNGETFTYISAGRSFTTTGFSVNLCFSYRARPESFRRPVKVFYVVSLDSSIKKEQPRVSFKLGSRQPVYNGTVSISKENTTSCVEQPVYLLPNIVDKLSPVDINVTVHDVAVTAKKRSKRSTTESAPVLNKIKNNEHLLSVELSKNCGPDNICQSEFGFHSYMVEKVDGESAYKTLPMINNSGEHNLTIGVKKEFGLYIESWNNKEDAHQAVLDVHFPVQLKFINVVKTINNKKGIVFTCNEEKVSENNPAFGKITCDVGNPYRKGKKYMLIKFGIDDSLSELKTINITVTANTTSAQTKVEDQTSLARIFYISEVVVDGFVKNKFKSVGFSGDEVGQSAVKRPEDAGLYVFHHYEIANNGLNDLNDVTVKFSWPNQLANEKWLLYYIETALYNGNYREITNRGFTCKSENNVTNPLKLKYVSEDKPRLKRSIDEPKENNLTMSKQSSEENIKQKIKFYCPEYEGCLNVECEIEKIPKKSSRILEIRSVLWNTTLMEEYRQHYESIEVRSNLEFAVNRTDYIFSSQSKLNATIISTVRNESPKPVENKVKFWHIIVAVCVGVFLVILIVLACWKLGFFKRNKYKPAKFHQAKTHQCATEQYSNQTNENQR